MKIVLDRRSCDCWEPACEAHFGWHFLREDVTPVDCTVEMMDDGKSEITFFIKDRDGDDKILVVDETNRDVAYDSWFQAYEDQQEAEQIENPES